MDIVDRLMGPLEWGYRDPVEGGFIEDRTPFEAADQIDVLKHRIVGLQRANDRLQIEVTLLRGQRDELYQRIECLLDDLKGAMAGRDELQRLFNEARKK